MDLMWSMSSLDPFNNNGGRVRPSPLSNSLASGAPASQLARPRFSLEALHFFPEAVHEHQVERPSHVNDGTCLLGHVPYLTANHCRVYCHLICHFICYT
jgi:hypothetical protein